MNRIISNVNNRPNIASAACFAAPELAVTVLIVFYHKVISALSQGSACCCATAVTDSSAAASQDSYSAGNSVGHPQRPDDSMVFPTGVTSQDTRPSVRFGFQLLPPHSQRNLLYHSLKSQLAC